MIAYLIELAYDISINTLANVSTNPWFESVVEFFLIIYFFDKNILLLSSQYCDDFFMKKRLYLSFSVLT